MNGNCISGTKGSKFKTTKMVSNPAMQWDLGGAILWQISSWTICGVKLLDKCCWQHWANTYRSSSVANKKHSHRSSVAVTEWGRGHGGTLAGWKGGSSQGEEWAGGGASANAGNGSGQIWGAERGKGWDAGDKGKVGRCKLKSKFNYLLD